MRLDTKMRMLNIGSFSFVLAVFSLSTYFFLSLDVLGFENAKWNLGEDMHTNRTEITGAVLGDEIFVIGGADYREDGAVDTVEIYDPVLNEWALGPSLPYEIMLLQWLTMARFM